MSSIRYIISAPSGSGKTTLVNELRQYVPNLEFSVSYTTRAPRGSEEDGREYHFISRDDFEAMIARDAFLQFAGEGGVGICIFLQHAKANQRVAFDGIRNANRCGFAHLRVRDQD